MRKIWTLIICPLVLLLFSLNGSAMIFGADDRLERYELRETQALGYARSTAAIALRSHFKRRPDGGLDVDFAAGTQRSVRDGACTPAFEGQPELVSYCSASLIAPDLLLTAGHCFYRGSAQTPESVCAESVAIFDYAITSKNSDPVHFKPSQIYACAKLELYSHEGDRDFAVVRLDRKISDRKILKLATPGHSTSLLAQAPYWTSGYPKGRPNKTQLNAQYFDFWGAGNSSALFQMESEGGSSGSSVYDPRAQRVIGLFASSDCDDYEWSEANQCFSEPHYQGQCRGVRVVLLENLGVQWLRYAFTELGLDLDLDLKQDLELNL